MSSIWPGAVATDSNLYVAVDFPNSVTALNGAINSSVTSINVTNATNYPSSGGFILIDSELIYFAGVSGNTLTGCLRGQDGTLAASHLNNAGVNLVTVAEHHNVLKDEIIAIETSLNLAPSLALVSDGFGRVDVSSTTSTEIGYVHGVTSAIQTQLNTKVDTAGTGLSKTGTTLNLSIPVSTANGGTGQTSYTDGQLLIGSTSGSTLNKSTITGTVNQVIVTNGSGSITLSTPQNIAITSSPSFQQLTLGSTTLGGIVFNDTEVSPKTITLEAPTTVTTSYILKLPLLQGGASTFLQNDGSGNLSWVAGGGSGVTSITGTTHQIIASSPTGAVTLSTPQDIDTVSSPTFAGLSLTGDQTITVNDSSTTEVLLALTNSGTGQAVMSFTADSATNYIGTNTNGGFYMATAEPIGTNSFLFYAGGILQLASTGPINLEPGTNVVVSNGSLSISSGSVTANSAMFVNTTDQLVLGTTRTVTISATQPATSSRTYTIPDQGANANIVGDQANYTIAGTWTMNNNLTYASSKGPKLTDNTTNTVQIKATNSTTSYTLSLPTTAGTSGYVLSTDGSGNTSWIATSNIVASVALTSQGANISSTPLFVAPSTGLYQICAAIFTTTSDAGAGTAALNVSWTDDLGADTTSVDSVDLTGTGAGGGGFAYIEAVSGTTVSYDVSGGGPYGAAKYSLYLSAIKVH